MSGAHHRRQGNRIEHELVDRHKALGAATPSLSFPNGQRSLLVKCRAASADRRRQEIITAVRFEDGTGRRACSLQAGLELLEREVAELGDARMMLIAPVLAYMGPKSIRTSTRR